MAEKGKIQTKDGTRLSYLQVGPPKGENILFLPGWRQTAAQWRKQIQYFQTGYRVTTFDHRGHGDSEKPTTSYTVQLLASDLYDVIHGLNLEDITVIGHSMGSAVTWAFWKNFPDSRNRIKRIVIADQAPCLLIDPNWSEEETKQFGAVFTKAQLDGLNDTFDAMAPGLIKSMFTDKISEEDLAWVVTQNEKCPKEIAIELLKDHVSQDWRRVLPELAVPTLIVGGEGSLFSVESDVWIHEQVANSKLVIIGKNEGGSHFAFWENPDKFNAAVEDFMRGTATNGHGP